MDLSGRKEVDVTNAKGEVMVLADVMCLGNTFHVEKCCDMEISEMKRDLKN